MAEKSTKEEMLEFFKRYIDEEYFTPEALKDSSLRFRDDYDAYHTILSLINGEGGKRVTTMEFESAVQAIIMGHRNLSFPTENEVRIIVSEALGYFGIKLVIAEKK